MRKLVLAAAAVLALTLSGLAVAGRLDEGDGKSVKAVAATFGAATVSNSQTRTCTTPDGKSVASTNATYSGTAAGAPELTGAITLQVHSTINTTDGVGVLSGRLKIAASGGDTVAGFDAVYDHGNVAGFAEGHAQSHTKLLGNVSAVFDPAKGFAAGAKIGGATAGGSAVEIGPARCASTKSTRETSEAHGTVSAVSSTSITVAGLTCSVPPSLAAQVSTVKMNDRVEITCSLVSGVNTLVKIEK